MKKINTAIIGAGRIGRMHAENIIRNIPEANLQVVFDKYKKKDWLKKLGASQEVEVTDGLKKILNDSSIEAVVIASSTTSHVPLIEAMIPYQKNIFCEKPIALQSASIKKLQTKLRKSKAVFQVGYNRRFDPQFVNLKNSLKEIGKMYIIKIINRDPLRPPLSFIPKSGGLFFDFNTHDFDMVHYLSQQQVKEVTVMADNLIDAKIAELGDVDTALITLRLTNGALVNIDCSRETHYGYDQQIEVLGSKGSIKADNVRENTLMLSKKDAVKIANPSFNFVSRYKEAFLNQMQSFYSSIANKIPASVGLEDAKNAIAVAEAVSRSFKQKKTVEVKY